MPAGAGSFEVLGWLFSARDMASAVATKAQQTVDAAAADINVAFDSVASGVERGTKVIGGAFASVGRDAAKTMAVPFVAALSLVQGGWETFKGAAESIKTTLFETQFSFAQLPGAIKKTGEGLFLMGRKAAGAAVQVNSLFQRFLDLGDLKATLGKGGGLIGTFLGPLGGIFKLLTPIIDLVSKIFAPLIEGISDHLSNVLGPLQMTMEMIAQDLGPKLAKLLVPIVSLIEIMVSEAGVFISKMLEGGTVAGPLVKGVMDIIPSVMKLFGAIGATVVKVLPVFLHIFQRAVPIVAKVVEHVAEFAAELLPKLGDIIAKVGPKLIDAFAKTLDALIPILPVLGKLAIVLVDKVLGPAMVKTLIFLAEWISEDLVPFIEKWMPAVILLIEDVATRVDDFFSNFDKYMRDFKILFLDPIKNGINEILAMFGLGDLASQWDKMTKAFMAPLETLKQGINALIIDPINEMLKAELFGKTLGGLLDITPFKFLAEGGVATGAGPVQGIFGEAGPELIMPLTPNVVERVLEPILDLPGLDRAVAVLERIDRKLGGVLRVDAEALATGGGGGPPGASRQADDIGLFDAVGISGVT